MKVDRRRRKDWYRGSLTDVRKQSQRAKDPKKSGNGHSSPPVFEKELSIVFTSLEQVIVLEPPNNRVCIWRLMGAPPAQARVEKADSNVGCATIVLLRVVRMDVKFIRERSTYIPQRCRTNKEVERLQHNC